MIALIKIIFVVNYLTIASSGFGVRGHKVENLKASP